MVFSNTPNGGKKAAGKKAAGKGVGTRKTWADKAVQAIVKAGEIALPAPSEVKVSPSDDVNLASASAAVAQFIEEDQARKTIREPLNLEGATPPDIDLDNKSARSLVGIGFDTSRSLEAELSAQFHAGDDTLRELADDPAAKSITMACLQIGSHPTSSGFRDVDRLRMPTLKLADGSQLHHLLDKFVIESEATHRFLRMVGLGTNKSVFVLLSDGQFNGTEPNVAELRAASIKRFHKHCDDRNITPVIVAIAGDTNEGIDVVSLRRLITTYPLITPEKLTGNLLLKLIRELAITATLTGANKDLEFEVPIGFITLD